MDPSSSGCLMLQHVRLPSGHARERQHRARQFLRHISKTQAEKNFAGEGGGLHVKVWSRPKGFPIANTLCPTWQDKYHRTSGSVVVILWLNRGVIA